MFYDLFNSFDYCSSSSLTSELIRKIKWEIPLAGAILWFIGKKSFWGKYPRSLLTSSFKIFFTNKNWNYLFGKIKGVFLLVFFAIFFLIALNLMGLFPYIFSKTGQVLFVFFVSFGCWCAVVLSNLLFKALRFLHIFFPKRPGFILPFLNLIEIISFFIRPVTLMLRLSINITTGHIFVILLRKNLNFLFLTFSWRFVLVLLVRVFIFFFERCIGLIQGLVFSLLLTSYFDEHNY